MGSVKSYKELIVWQKAIKLVKEIYLLTNSFPEDEKYGLVSQMRRSVVSVPSNIAEGWGRMSKKSYILFLRTARGSLFELETQIIISAELNFFTNTKNIESLIIEISKMLNALIKSLNERE
ncbi:four helix bundle protein [Aequorivita echinoideorum]|uniref:Four helix bundle protein n=1 Tax=Aequorivita echinoideorum TaxID=1549647 RepID=A0ABS5S161_9FLAO|nr:four helix bundle protein [Aequorivita echinoideorum]MBT0606946.1 four helix bundle protein [Aequorivita echinoideorum]